MPEKRNHRGYLESRTDNMRALFRRFIRWITQADRFEGLQHRLSILETQGLLRPLVSIEEEDLEPYDYGMLGEAYRIMKNHELVTKRDF